MGSLIGASVAASALAIVLPAGATAAAGPVPLLTSFGVTASNDYRVRVLSLQDVVLLNARSGGVAANYVVRGRIAPGRIEARFGSLGRIALSIRDPRRGDRRQACEISQPAVFTGVIKFRGERGYTEVDARRARGRVFAIPTTPECIRGEPRPSSLAAAASAVFDPFEPWANTHTRLYAIAREDGRTTSVEVQGKRGSRRLGIEALLQERRGAMLIAREATALIGGRNSFVSSGVGVEPGFAFLKPPKPFSGSATHLQTGQASSTWDGDLAAWLPGIGPVRFAGPRFSSNLCRQVAGDPGCPPSPTVQRPFRSLE